MGSSYHLFMLKIVKKSNFESLWNFLRTFFFFVFKSFCKHPDTTVTHPCIKAFLAVTNYFCLQFAIINSYFYATDSLFLQFWSHSLTIFWANEAVACFCSTCHNRHVLISVGSWQKLKVRNENQVFIGPIGSLGEKWIFSQDDENNATTALRVQNRTDDVASHQSVHDVIDWSCSELPLQENRWNFLLRRGKFSIFVSQASRTARKRRLVIWWTGVSESFGSGKYLSVSGFRFSLRLVRRTGDVY